MRLSFGIGTAGSGSFAPFERVMIWPRIKGIEPEGWPAGAESARSVFSKNGSRGGEEEGVAGAFDDAIVV